MSEFRDSRLLHPIYAPDDVRAVFEKLKAGSPMDNEAGGFLVPRTFKRDLSAAQAGDPGPRRPRWWQFWRRATYRHDLAAWEERWPL